YARPERVFELVCIVVGALMVIGPAGREIPVPNSAAVQLKLVDAQRCHVNGSAVDRLCGGEFFAVLVCRWKCQRTWRFRNWRIVTETDIVGFPIFGLEQAHAPGGCLAPLGRFSVFVPHSDFPKTLLTGDKGFAGV